MHQAVEQILKAHPAHHGRPARKQHGGLLCKDRSRGGRFCGAAGACGATASNGGSVSLAETGVMELLAGGRYHYLDRSKVQGDELAALYRQVFSADWYFASANAVTEAGEIYNVDGNANRVAAITFWAQNVLLVVGCNKLVAICLPPKRGAPDRGPRQHRAPWLQNALRRDRQMRTATAPAASAAPPWCTATSGSRAASRCCWWASPWALSLHTLPDRQRAGFLPGGPPLFPKIPPCRLQPIKTYRPAGGCPVPGFAPLRPPCPAHARGRESAIRRATAGSL